MMIFNIQIIIILSYITLAWPSDQNVTYNDLKSMGVSCPERNKCSGYDNNISYKERSCECDPLCVHYDDCCVDAPARLDSLRQFKGDNVMCLNYGNTDHTGVYVLSNCSKKWDGPSVVRDGCIAPPNWRDPFSSIPLTDTDQALTYRNLYCAQCNNANMKSLKHFNIRMSCKGLEENLTSDEIIAEITYDEKLQLWGLNRTNPSGNNTFYECSMKFDVPDHLNKSLRFCRSNITSTCSSDWHEESIKKACHDYMAVVYVDNQAYRNPHCAICNHKTLDKISCTSENHLSDRNRPMSYTFLLNMNQRTGYHLENRRFNPILCPSGHVYDTFFKMCRMLVCALEYHVIINGRCIPVLI